MRQRPAPGDQRELAEWWLWVREGLITAFKQNPGASGANAGPGSPGSLVGLETSGGLGPALRGSPGAHRLWELRFSAAFTERETVFQRVQRKADCSFSPQGGGLRADIFLRSDPTKR